jgi:hypothetical protein
VVQVVEVNDQIVERSLVVFDLAGYLAAQFDQS